MGYFYKTLTVLFRPAEIFQIEGACSKILKEKSAILPGLCGSYQCTPNLM
jgi:hypothetical protein